MSNDYLIPLCQIGEIIDDPIIMVDWEGRIHYKNEHATTLLIQHQLDETLHIHSDVYENWKEFYKMFVNSSPSKQIVVIQNTRMEKIYVSANITQFTHSDLYLLRIQSISSEKPTPTNSNNIFQNLMKLFNELNKPTIFSKKDGTIVSTNNLLSQFLPTNVTISKIEKLEDFLGYFHIGAMDLKSYAQSINLDGQGDLLLSKSNVTDESLELSSLYLEEIDLLITTINPIKTVVQLQNSDEGLILLGENASKILHEINNPLSTLKGYLSIMKKKYGFQEDYFSIVQQELKKIESLTSDLLYLANPKKNLYERFQFIEVVDEVVELFEEEIWQLGCSLLFTADIPNETYVFGNRIRIKQVLINLVKNSLEAMQENSGSRRLGIQVMKQYNYIVLNIYDNGPGIPESELEKIFQPFYTTKQNGTGLGLAISRQLIEEHGGKLTVIPSETIGSNFNIKLPVDIQSALDVSEKDSFITNFDNITKTSL